MAATIAAARMPMKSDRVQIPRDVIDQAADWLLVNREAGVSLRDREQFADWLRHSPLHVRAYLEVAGLWSDAAQLDSKLAVDLALDRPGASRVIALPTAHPP